MTYRLVTGGNPLSAGILYVDVSGAGTGPWIPGSVLIDPTGTNALIVNSDGSITANGKVQLIDGAGHFITAQITSLGVYALTTYEPLGATSANQAMEITALQSLAGTVNGIYIQVLPYGAQTGGLGYINNGEALSLNIAGTAQGWTGVNPTGGIYAAQIDGAIFNYKNITGDATTTVKSSAGALHSITFNAPTATETITIWDNTSAAGTKIGTITIPASPQPFTLVYDVTFATGLTIVTATATSDITVSFR